jgi:hypothetical protein
MAGGVYFSGGKKIMAPLSSEVILALASFRLNVQAEINSVFKAPSSPFAKSR